MNGSFGAHEGGDNALNFNSFSFSIEAFLSLMKSFLAYFIEKKKLKLLAEITNLSFTFHLFDNFWLFEMDNEFNDIAHGTSEQIMEFLESLVVQIISEPRRFTCRMKPATFKLDFISSLASLHLLIFHSFK